MLVRVCLIFAVLPISACSWRTDANAGVGQVEKITGQPMVFRGAGYMELGPASTIELQDSLITGPGDKVAVLFNDRTVLSLGTNTQVTIHEYASRGKERKLRLGSTGGRYQLTSRKRFIRQSAVREINTPFASIRVNTTDLLVEHSEDARQLKVTQLSRGTVLLVNQFGESQLKGKGDVSIVRFGHLPSAPFRYTEHELRDAVESIHE